MYDYIIVGAGPTGLTLAWYLAKINKKILLIEAESVVGGCHRVRRVNRNGINYFTEHGPRIYLSNYFSLIQLLKEMNVNFYDLFTPYDFGVNIPAQQIMSEITPREFVIFAYEFIKFGINDSESKQTSVLEFLQKNNFSDQMIKTIDRICRLTDGGTIEKYTLFEFFQVINQNFFYRTYQPKKPNDIALFKIWVDKLRQTSNVDILLNTTITKIIFNQNGSIAAVTDSKTLYTATRYIFTIPPVPFAKVLENSANPNIFGNINKLKEWATNTRYFTYIPITFHWTNAAKVEKVWGSTASDWGIIFIILSDYMTFTESKTVIITSVTLADQRSAYTGKTANESSEKELIEETFRQLRLYHPNLTNPNVSLISPGIFRKNNKWDTVDVPFVLTKSGYFPEIQYKNLYWIGTHSGLSNYNFTAMESAMENATSLLRQIEPGLKNLPKYRIISVWSVFALIVFIIAIITIIFFLYKYNNGFANTK